MTSLPRRVIGKVVSFRDGEAPTALLMFAYSFLAMSAYNVIKPITRSQFIVDFGPENLPYVQLVAGLMSGVLMLGYAKLASMIPRRWVIPVTVGGEAVLLVIFWGLFRTDAMWVSVAFYVFGLTLGVLLISQFWTLANDIYDPRQAKRLFGFIGGGSSLGGVMGGGLTIFAIKHLGTNNLLLASATMLLLCAGMVYLIVRDRQIKQDLSLEERGVGGAESIRLLRSSRHLQVIALVIGFAAIGAAIIEQQLNMAAAEQKGGDTDTITLFLANVTVWLSVAGFIVQVFLTSRIHRSMGLAFALLVLPVSLGSTAVIVLVTGAVWAPGLARVFDSSLRYTVDKTTREILFLPLPVDIKYRAKPFIDVTMDRLSKALGALIALVLINKTWGFHFTWQRLSYASLAVMAFWIFGAMLARREYLRAFRRSIGERALSPAIIRLEVADAATIETLVEELANPDEAAVLYAIDMLETLDKRGLVTPLLLHHQSPRVRARALIALEFARPHVAERWLPFVERMLKDEDADVRAGAMRALAAISKADAPALMRTLLSDPEPRVAVTAAVALSGAGGDDALAAEATFKRIIADTRGAAAAGRREAALALGRITTPAFRSLLVPLLNDRDPDVVREAIRSVRAIGEFDALFVPALLSLLGHRAVKREAREVLTGYGEAATDALAYVLRDPDEQIWVRRHIPTTLALLPSQKSMDALFAVLDDSDGFLRFKAVEAIEMLRRKHADFVFPRASIEARVIKETARYYNCLTLRYNVVTRSAKGQESLLVRTLENKLDRILDRIYRLLGLIYPWKDIDDARFAIEHGDARTSAGGVEYLDNLLHGQIRGRVMPIIDPLPLAEKVKHANSVLKSRPRDLEDTLAQLIHDDDPIVSASAIHFIEAQAMWSLTDDIEFVLEHRSAADWCVFEAASWAMAARRVGEHRNDLWLEPLPAVELVDRMRGIALFDFVSVDELFRIAALGRQLRHEHGRRLYLQGARAEDVQFLIDGAVDAPIDGARPAMISAPAALAFEEVLEDRPVRRTIETSGRAVCLALGREDLLTVLSDNIAVAKGLFRMLITTNTWHEDWEATAASGNAEGGPEPNVPLQPIDKVRVLREHPLLARATVEELLDLAAITREVGLSKGSVLFNPHDRPAIYHVLQGEVLLEAEGSPPVVATAGKTIGVTETLAGQSLGRRATVTHTGRALYLGHDDLFVVLADHIDLLQGLFSGVLGAATKPASAVAPAAPPDVCAPATATPETVGVS